MVMGCTECALDERGICFRHKLRSLSWGRVPGGAREGKNYFDREALESQIGDLDRNAAYTREATEGYGALRWDNGEAYYQDRNTGDFNKATASDMDKVMYGSSRRKETARSFGVGSGRKPSEGSPGS
jgi:hypothetical protein